MPLMACVELPFHLRNLVAVQSGNARKATVLAPERHETLTLRSVRAASAHSKLRFATRVGTLGVLLNLAAVSTAAAGPQATKDATVDPLAAYGGKYADFGPFERLAAELPQMRAEALERIEQRLGLTAKNADRIRIELRDALDEDADPIRQFNGMPFRTSLDGDDLVVVLHAEFMINRRFDVETELLHELTHAVVRSNMTPESYRSVPEWIREGLAVWTAEQVEDKATILIRAQDEPSPVSALLKGLEGGPETLDRYAEYGLAIEMIEQRHGGDAVKELARQIVQGAPARDAAAKAIGQAWEAFEQAARQYAQERLEQIAPPEIDVYFEMRQADKRRDYKTVIEKADELLKAGSLAPLTGSVLYWRGKACRMLGRTADAEKSLRRLLAMRDRASEWVEGALYQQAKARVEAEEYRRALQPLQKLLRDHPDSSHQDNVVYYLALCRARMGKKIEARQLLDLFDRSFAGSGYAERARELREEIE